jgi:hypothetical protein
MKILMIAAFALFSLSVNASGRKEKTIASYRTTQSLASEFGHVENVKWSNAANNLIRADFVLDEQSVSAFFNEDGEYVASTRELTLDYLNKKLRNAITKLVPAENITQIIYMTTKDEGNYYIETKTDGVRKVWKCTETGDVSPFKTN